MEDTAEHVTEAALLTKVQELNSVLREQVEERIKIRETGANEDFVDRSYKKLKSFPWLRHFAIVSIILCFSTLLVYSIWGLLPRYYSLSISGGNVLSNRHHLAYVLAEQGKKEGIYLNVRPISGTLQILDAVDRGEIDVALIQGGIDIPKANVRHVSGITSETMHLLVKAKINDIHELKGKNINIGSKTGGTRIVAKEVLSFSGLQEGVDYVATSISNEDLLSLPDHKMPDAIIIISSVPSFFAEELINARGYRILEIPFPHSLALRFGWVVTPEILPYTYTITPAIPNRVITSLGINMFMVCNANVPPRAIAKLLTTLYGSGVQTTMRQQLNPQNITTASGYAISEGTELFLKRNEPLLDKESIYKMRGLIGLVTSLLTLLYYLTRWLRGKPSNQVNKSVLLKVISPVIVTLAECAVMLQKLIADGALSKASCAALILSLTEIRKYVLEMYIDAKSLDDVTLSRVLEQVDDMQERLQRVDS